jgi:Raf kinase inhibitor-like YbhB/YbcL family protein
MRTWIAGLLIALLGCSAAEAGPPAYERAETQTSGRLTVTSTAFAAGGTIPLRYSAYGNGVSPPLAWTGAPAGTRSFVLFVEDPDATSAKPYVHWLVWNIAADRPSLPEGVGPAAAGLVQGRNNQGDNAWFGPRPRGRSPHRYYFELFALDTELALAPRASRADVLKAMDGHVLASGWLLGTFQQPK